MKYIAILLSFSAILLQSSCDVDRPIPSSELPTFENKLVVNAVLDNTRPFEIGISTNVSAYTEDLPTFYEDATVILRSDQSNIPLTYDNSSKTYKSTTIPAPGNSYRIEVIDNTGLRKTVNARGFVPAKALNKKIGYIENGGVDMDGRSSDLLSIEWTDISLKNYYILHFYYYSPTAQSFVPFEFELTDPTLSAPETLRLDDGGYLFNDDLFNGTTKKIQVVPPGGLVAGNPDELYLIELRTVTSDYYKYYKTLQQYRDQDDLQQAGPFGSAVIVHSNVTNGLGAFLTSTLESDTIR